MIIPRPLTLPTIAKNNLTSDLVSNPNPKYSKSKRNPKMYQPKKIVDRNTLANGGACIEGRKNVLVTVTGPWRKASSCLLVLVRLSTGSHVFCLGPKFFHLTSHSLRLRHLLY